MKLPEYCEYRPITAVTAFCTPTAEPWIGKTALIGLEMLEQPPELTHVVGTNEAQLFAAQDERGSEVQVMIVIDNLVKGAGGQAVQARNLALGSEETRGLVAGGIFPC